MNPQIAKTRARIQKNKERISSWQDKNLALSKQLEGMENTEIIGIVREIGMTPEELAEHFADRLPIQKPRKTRKKEDKSNEPDPT